MMSLASHDLLVTLQRLGVLSSGLVCGGQVFVLFVVVRTLRAVSPLDSLHLHQAMLSTDYPDTYIQPSGILTFVLAAALLAIGPRTKARVVLTTLPMVAIACIAVLTRTINRPINRKLGTSTDANIAQYPADRRRWDRSHAVRTGLGTAAFLSFIVLASL